MSRGRSSWFQGIDLEAGFIYILQNYVTDHGRQNMKQILNMYILGTTSDVGQCSAMPIVAYG